jgi:CheY-like chemotaxis protein
VATAAAERPEVILLDLLMPGMDGWQVLGALREDKRTRGIPVIVVSGIIEAGQATVPKPVDESMLLREVNRALGEWNSGDTVLLVEDDPDLAHVLAGYFAEHGLRVIVAADGREAIRLSEQERPSLFVLDLMLPQTDGFAVADWLRRHDRLHTVPIVVYTARDLDEADRARLGLAPELLFTKSRIPPHELAERVVGFIGRMARTSGTGNNA